MKLYLVQHGLAKSEEEDPERSLSDKGIYQSEKLAGHLASLHIGVDCIFHSPKLRARETALILARQLKPSGLAAQRDGLAPKDDPAIWEERLQDEDGEIMLVGHLPHLARFASLLLCGDSERDIISFKNSGVACLDSGDDSSWSVSWMLVPELLGKE